ncbi:MAG: hypothetical protein JRM82_04795 [Nitrososphaerota archaeon]|nr:hypothetical protein [Nitrososphaerota archaeon]
MRMTTGRYYRKSRARSGVGGTAFKARSRPGRGPAKLIPMRNAREQEQHYGRMHPMNRLAKDMGHANATKVPDDEIDGFVRRLVDRYTERSARGMVQSQVNFRANSRNPKVVKDREKFERMMASLDSQQ